MRFLAMVLRNTRRNPIRSLLTIGSLAISLSLSVMLVSLATVGGEVSRSTRGMNRIIVMSSQGFTQPVPIARVAEVTARTGVVGATPFSWYGGKYQNESIPFAQFGIDADNFFDIFDELSITADQLKSFKADRSGCVIGRKLADERKIKVGDLLPLKDGVYPIDLTLNVRGIYDGPITRNLRACYFHWNYIEEGMKKRGNGEGSGNAGTIIIRCKDQDRMKTLGTEIDESYSNSDTPTRTQSEEAFANMFAEMAGDFRVIIIAIGLAVGASLLTVSGNAMAMALRERTTEVAVLKAIGFGKPLVVSLILAESVLVAAVGGVIGSLGCKAFCDVVDISKYSSGFIPLFYVPWTTAIGGLVVALGIGFFSGFFPAVRASRISVVNGLRKVV